MTSEQRIHGIAFLFGAGARKPFLPDQSELVLAPSRARDKRLRPAIRYLRRIFPGVESGLVTFEDIIGPLEIAESEEYWHHFAGPMAGRIVTNQSVLFAMDFWLATALDPHSVPKYPKDPSVQPVEVGLYHRFYEPSRTATCPYAGLLAALQDRDLLPQAAFLSLNYDILLDRCLLASSAFLPDYRIDGFHEPPSTDGRKDGSKRGVPVLKLHGSLNWRVYDSCHVLRNFKSRVIWPGSRCGDCLEERARPMFIRPTLLKDFRHRVWQMLWREAEHALAEARDWVVVGYSPCRSRMSGF